MKIPVSEPTINQTDVQAVTDCLKSGWISSAGPAIKDFGQAFAGYIGAKHALPVATGTAALHLSLLALGIKPGDEVIVPALTFVSPASMVAALGAKPVFVDVSTDSFVMDPKQIAKKITQKTKAIIVVHLYGFSVDLKSILRVAKKRHLPIIEDCAEALGAKYQGKKVGSFGDLACFSFYANKFITTGEGGMVVAKNQKLFQKVQLFCDHGMTKQRRYYHQVVGFNYRMTAMQASLGLSQLKRLKTFLKQRDNILKRYQKQLKNLSQVEWAEPVKNSRPVTWLVTVLLPNLKVRNSLHQFLLGKEIETRKVFDPIPGMPPYPTKDKFPQTQSTSYRGLSLPTFAHLNTQQINTVCQQIETFFKS